MYIYVHICVYNKLGCVARELVATTVVVPTWITVTESFTRQKHHELLRHVTISFKKQNKEWI